MIDRQLITRKMSLIIKDLAMQMRTRLEALEQGAAPAGCRYQPLLAMDMWVESKNLSRISTALEPL